MTVLKGEVVVEENGEPLADLSTYNFVLDPKYFQMGLASSPKMYLRYSVAEKLLAAQRQLKKYKFKIWDALRTRATQEAIYKKYQAEVKKEHPDWSEEQIKVQVEQFIFPYYRFDLTPPHMTGGTIDLTLVDETGKELDMGTAFDYFGPEAAPDFFEKTKPGSVVEKNRNLLKQALEDQNFFADPDEWWHFDFGNQRWALGLGKSRAVYGEVALPQN